MAHLPQEFIHKLAHMLDDEELDLYLLMLHFKNKEDLSYFTPDDQKKILNIFDVLIKDTKHHAELLQLIVELVEK